MSRGSVLVVDDEPGLLDVLEWELSSLDFDVLTVGSGTNAVQILKQTEFDVIISDVRMPGLSGIDVLRTAKGLSPDTEVIIATGYAEMDTVVECVRGGAFDFVQKPFNLPSVMATVERAVERRQLRASAQLYQASLAISANRDPQKLPELIADSAIKILDADAVGLWLPAKDSVYLAHRATKPGKETLPVPLKPDAMARVARLGRPKLLPLDAGGDEDLKLPAPITGIVYPLKVGDRLAGVLSMGRWSETRPFRRGDVERASALASQVLLAIENSRLTTQAAANERLATIGQLAAGVAHEINNPVSYVLMSLEGAKELLPGLPALAREELKSMLADAEEGAGRIRDIVSDLRNMSRADGANRRRVSVNDVVRAAIRVSGAELRHRAKVELQLGEGVEVDGDSGRLTQVLTNLLVNAAHAMADRPHHENLVVVKSWLAGDIVKVSVTDNGSGIAPENHARIFDAFFTTKAPGVGTGLGLPISREIARAHGGDVELSSKPGEGACFTVTLPRAGAQVEQHVGV
ncbi:MAG: response regulator [Myxococcaceae bacterium]|nr:response regulator [Myxococcaceae bacterium]